MSVSRNVETIGTDQEVFLVDNDNQVVSAIDLIGGTKEEPRIVPHGNLQEDNVLAEFAIDPVDNVDDLIRNIGSVMNSLEQSVSYNIDISSARVVPELQLQHPKANEFGCDPDIDAYSGQTRETIDSGKLKFLGGGQIRSAGGHIHLGIPRLSNIDLRAKRTIARALDFTVGFPLRIIDPYTDLRDMAYGGYGSLRYKEYGLEYRTPSNIWITSPELIKWVFTQCGRTVDMLFNYLDDKSQLSKKEKRFVEAIDGRAPDSEISYFLFNEFNPYYANTFPNYLIQDNIKTIENFIRCGNNGNIKLKPIRYAINSVLPDIVDFSLLTYKESANG